MEDYMTLNDWLCLVLFSTILIIPAFGPGKLIADVLAGTRTFMMQVMFCSLIGIWIRKINEAEEEL
jgi:hypothetical protein